MVPNHSETRELQDFWKMQTEAVATMSPEDLKNHCLPLARIKKIMKSDEDVRMISAEAPVLFSKACEIFILELTRRAWTQSEVNKRRTLQRSDIAAAISEADVFDFLVDIVPRDGSAKHGDHGSMEIDSQPHPTLYQTAVMSQFAYPAHGISLEPQLVSPMYPPFQQFASTNNILAMNPPNAASDCNSGTEFGKALEGNGDLE